MCIEASADLAGSDESNHFIQRAERALDAMEIPTAFGLFQRAEASGHNADSCAAGRWTCHMLNGEFERAWLESDAIELRGRPDPHRYWDGEPFEGKKVILRCLHGLGDTIQFIRFAPQIRRQTRSLTVEAQPVLKSLVAASGLADNVITWGEAEPEWNQQVEVNELPRIFRVTASTIPTSVPYLRVAAASARAWNDSDSLKVGLVWGSSEYNPLRSIPLVRLARLLEMPGVSFFSFQAGPACSELRPWARSVENLSEHAASVLETAQHMVRMDLLISVDTMAAHLAGALAIPVWTLLPFACDWRWMTGREDSPWYPTMKLFRQTSRGDWDPVLQRVAEALRRIVRDRSGIQLQLPQRLSEAGAERQRCQKGT